MWIVRGIILLAGVVAFLWMETKNAGTKVTFHLFTKTFVDIELNLILVVSFIFGIVLSAIGSWIREAQLLFRLTRIKKLNRTLREEISDLRNLPLEEDGSDYTLDQ
ncbi:MAG: LapA family protein [Candidatus Krumholzibacteriota bacterium]|nr:LapA family protein [Candidatus Krumholzibacteriota bacterium]